MPFRLSRLSEVARALRVARELDSHDRWSRDQLAAHQDRQLRALLAHAAAHSRFYRERLAGLDLERVPLAELPVLDKSTLIERFDDLVTDPRLRLAELEAHLGALTGDAFYLGEYRVMATGGSSGQRAVFVYDRDEWSQLMGGVVRNNGNLLGLRPRLPRRRRLGAVFAGSPLHMTARMGSTLDVGLFRILRLDARQPLSELAARLDAFDPEAITGYASMLALLAGEQLAGRLRIRPRVVQTSSEVRTPEMSERIRAAWGLEPHDVYATTETGLLAADCDQHRGLHVFSDQTLLEVVDAEGWPVPDGTPGTRVLVTSLVKRAQPLIRYALTDLVSLSKEACPCGRPFPLLVGVEGRSDDVLQLPGRDGGTVPVHPLTLRSPMAGLSAVRQYRVIHDDTGLLVEWVGDTDPAPLGDAVRQALQRALEAAGVALLPIEVRAVSEIPRHPVSGKLRQIESRAGRS